MLELITTFKYLYVSLSFPDTSSYTYSWYNKIIIIKYIQRKYHNIYYGPSPPYYTIISSGSGLFDDRCKQYCNNMLTRSATKSVKKLLHYISNIINITNLHRVAIESRRKNAFSLIAPRRVGNFISHI